MGALVHEYVVYMSVCLVYVWAVYVCVYMCVCGLCECMCVQVYVQACVCVCVWCLELTNLARLAGQEVYEVCFPPLPLCWGYRDQWLFLAVFAVLLGIKRLPSCLHGKHVMN